MSEKKRKILYVLTSGINTPERLYAPFILAQTAMAMDIEATVYFVGMGITVLKKGECEKIKIGNLPTLKEVVDQSIEVGVKLLACDASCQLVGLTRNDLISEAKLVGAATLNSLVLESDGVMWF
jgi:predicted peroxiredoxin